MGSMQACKLMSTRTQGGSRRGSQAPTDLGGLPLSLYPCRQEGKHKEPWVSQLLWWQIQQSCCHSCGAMNSGVKLKSFGRDEGFTKQRRLNCPPSGLKQFNRGNCSEVTQIIKPSITEEKVKACLCFCSRRVTRITLLWWAAVSAALISARCLRFCPLSYLNDSHASLSKHSEQTGRAVLKTWHWDMFIL